MEKLYTIGFTKKSAENFFVKLQKNQITLVADVRLNNNGQLAGFAKEKDLRYFLSLFKIDFIHLVDFAPTKILRKKYHADWDFDQYKMEYLKLLHSRNSITNLDKSVLTHNRVCLLCSEPEADNCHRRLAAEEIAKIFKPITITHL